jgi:hypothetical protein
MGHFGQPDGISVSIGIKHGVNSRHQGDLGEFGARGGVVSE